MTRDIKDIITDMREIVKPYVAQMLFNENFEGKGNTDKAEFETEFEMLLTLAERGVTVEPQEWIPVKDSRKPKIRERGWVTDCDGEVWIMYYNDCDCYFNEFGDVFTEDDIIAWQPITEPSPYKGE